MEEKNWSLSSHSQHFSALVWFSLWSQADVLLPAPRNGVRDAPGQRWLGQGLTKKSWDAASLADPKAISQHFRGIRESCNLSGRIYRREQHRYFSYILDMAPWPGQLFRSTGEGWLIKWSLRKGMLEPCCTLTGAITAQQTEDTNPTSSSTDYVRKHKCVKSHQFNQSWCLSIKWNHDVKLSNQMSFYSWHCTGCPSPSCPTWDTLASCSKDSGCVMMLPKAYVNSHPWPSDSSCCNIFLCYALLPARHLAHYKVSLSTSLSFFWKVHHARWTSKAYLVFEVESGMWQWKTRCKRSVVLQKASVTRWHVECFEREGQASAESLQPQYRRHHWKWSPSKRKWKQ